MILYVLIVAIDVITWMIFIQVILTNLLSLGIIKFRIPVLDDIFDPLYKKIRGLLPVEFLGIDFSPFLLLVVLSILQRFLLSI